MAKATRSYHPFVSVVSAVAPEDRMPSVPCVRGKEAFEAIVTMSAPPAPSCGCVQEPGPWSRRINSVHVGVARLAAIKAVKAQMHAAGLKPNHVELAVIRGLANEHLDAHWDVLIEQAHATIAGS